MTGTQATREELEALLSELQEIAHLGSWEWFITENRVRWSDELYRIYGLRPGEVPATYEGYLSRVHPDDRARVHETVQRAYRNPGPFEFEERIVRPSGEVRWLLSRGRVTRDLRGQPVRMTGVCQDVTERKRIDAELRARAEALEKSTTDLEHFASVASQDLQEPLRTVASYTQLQQRRTDPQDATALEYGQFVAEGVKRMQELVADLSAYAQIGSRGVHDQKTALTDALADAMSALREALDATGASVGHDRLPVVTGDREQLALVFQHLLANALKFRGERPLEIHVSVEHDREGWQVSVRDNGIGIERGHLDRLFVMFERLHARERYPGTGLGLAICKKIIIRHGGRIWAESGGLGLGATFRFTLPERPASG